MSSPSNVTPRSAGASVESRSFSSLSSCRSLPGADAAIVLFLGNLSGVPLGRAWGSLCGKAGAAPRLKKVLEFLPQAQQEILRSGLPEGAWQSLQGILDRGVGMQGLQALYRCGQRWSRQGYGEAARFLFLALAEVAGSSTWGREGKDLADRARSRAELLGGGGSWIDRFEYEAPSLFSSLVDPVNLAAYAAGVTGYRLTKTLHLGRLLRAESVVGRIPFGHELLSSGLGLAVESGAFLGMSKFGHGLRGMPQDWGALSLGREYLKTFSDFGLMKVGGYFGLKGSQMLRGRASVVGRVLPDVGVYGGIVMAHPLGVLAGWNEEKPWGRVLGEGLVTLMHQKASGQISDVLLASYFPGLKRYQQSLELEARRLGEVYWNRLGRSLFSQGVEGSHALAVLGPKGPIHFLSEGSGESSGVGSGRKSPRDLDECVEQLTSINTRGNEIRELLELDHSTWIRVADALLIEVALNLTHFEGHPLLERSLSGAVEDIVSRFDSFRALKVESDALKFASKRFFKELDFMLYEMPFHETALGFESSLVAALKAFSAAYQERNIGKMSRTMRWVERVLHRDEGEALAGLEEVGYGLAAPKKLAPSREEQRLALRRDGLLQGMVLADLLESTSMDLGSSRAERVRDNLDRVLVDPTLSSFGRAIDQLAQRSDWLDFSLPFLLACHRGDVGRFWREHANLPQSLSKENLEITHLALNWLGLGFQQAANFNPERQIDLLSQGISAHYPSWASRFDFLRRAAVASHPEDLTQLRDVFGDRGGEAVLGHGLYHFYRHSDQPVEGFLRALQSPPEIRAQVVSLLGAAYGSQGGGGVFPYASLRLHGHEPKNRGGIADTEYFIRGIAFPDLPKIADVVTLRRS